MKESCSSPQTTLFLQHGWADSSRGLAQLGKHLAEPGMRVVIPDLGWWRTWWSFEPLRCHLEELALAESRIRPDAQWRIIGHSMGGLLWLEVLDRRRDLLSRIHSLILIASPVGGADLPRILQSLGLDIGISRDLSLDRRFIAEGIASTIPTLVIAGNTDGGSDGTIPVQSTHVNGARYYCIDRVNHADLRNNPQVAAAIHRFWQDPRCTQADRGLMQEIVSYLQAIPTMTDSRSRDFSRGHPVLTLPDHLQLYHWRSPLGFDQVFLVTNQGECRFSGFVGWLHRQNLEEAIASLERRYNVPRE